MTVDTPGPGKATRFFVILISFLTLDLLSWPIFFSYYLWVHADRSSFLNLDYMLAQHLRLGVDAFYSYGLLPVLVQHVLFSIFGRGYWPMVGCTIVVVLLLVVFWSLFLRYVSTRWLYLLAVVAISPFLLWINPNFPYSLVQLSMLFALLFLLRGRADIALAISVIGCFSVPSLPLLLTGLLAIYLVAEWWSSGTRSLPSLLRSFAPGVLTYLFLAAVLAAFFGARSLLVTAFPFMGLKYYYGARNTGLGDLLGFLHPAGQSLKYYAAYYVGTPATWWVLSTLGLVVFAALSAAAMIRNRRPDPRHALVVFCAILQLFFAFFAYRGEEQHIIYDPITAAGMLVAISIFPVRRFRTPLLVLFLCIGLAGELNQARRTLWAWKNTHRSPLTANLYAEPEYVPEMQHILKIAETQKVLLMADATGIHHYYPSLMPVDSWFFVSGLMVPPDRERDLASIRRADVVVEDLVSVPWFIERDSEAVSEIRSMCLTDVTKHYQIWWRHPPASAVCKPNPRAGRSSTEPPT